MLWLGLSAQAALTAAVPLSVVTETGDASCHDVDDGWAVAIASGGTPPFAYAWWPSGGDSQSTSGLGAGGYVVTVSDALGASAQATASINAPAPPWIDATDLPAAQAFEPYAAQLIAGGGNGTIVFAVGDGRLPRGLRLSPDGRLSGTPTAVGSSPFVVQAIDASGCNARQGYTLTVHPHADILFLDGFDPAA